MHLKTVNGMMRFYEYQVVFQEVPDEISLCFSISGCPLRCDGCHSPFLWKAGNGTELRESLYKSLLEKYKDMISCVLFMGGEWHENELISKLRYANENGLKTCLYTGLDSVSSEIKNELTYLKTGPWMEDRGGLSSPSTNQLFRNIKTNEILNHLFIKQ